MAHGEERRRNSAITSFRGCDDPFLWFLADRRIVSETNGTAARQLGAGKKDARSFRRNAGAGSECRGPVMISKYKAVSADRSEQDTGTH